MTPDDQMHPLLQQALDIIVIERNAVLAALLETYPQCSVIDWSRGRLACLEVSGVDVELLADIIQEVASLVWSERSQLVDGWYEEMSKGC
jgi:hypothetical protein